MVRLIHVDKNRCTPYFWSASVDKIPVPPLLHTSCEPAIGDIFVREVEHQGMQVWVLVVIGDQLAHWDLVYSLHNRRHPDDPTLFLSFPIPIGLTSKRVPTWVKENTARRHKPHLPKILID